MCQTDPLALVPSTQAAKPTVLRAPGQKPSLFNPESKPFSNSTEGLAASGISHEDLKTPKNTEAARCRDLSAGFFWAAAPISHLRNSGQERGRNLDLDPTASRADSSIGLQRASQSLRVLGVDRSSAFSGQEAFFTCGAAGLLKRFQVILEVVPQTPRLKLAVGGRPHEAQSPPTQC